MVRNRGIIGLTSIPSTLGENSSIDNLVESIRYLGESYGWEYPAIGTDFLGIPSTLKGLHSIRDLNALGGRLGEKADDVFWNNSSRVLNAILE